MLRGVTDILALNLNGATLSGLDLRSTTVLLAADRLGVRPALMRELDMIAATGEQVSVGLLAIALQNIGIPSRSWQGWQLPILTSGAHASARILDINGDELIKRFGREDMEEVFLDMARGRGRGLDALKKDGDVP